MATKISMDSKQVGHLPRAGPVLSGRAMAHRDESWTQETNTKYQTDAHGQHKALASFAPGFQHRPPQAPCPGLGPIAEHGLNDSCGHERAHNGDQYGRCDHEVVLQAALTVWQGLVCAACCVSFASMGLTP